VTTRGMRARRSPVRIGSVLLYALMIGLALVVVILPLWIVVVNSLKPLGEANKLGIGLPTTWTAVDNYSTVINQGQVLVGLRNTLLIAIPSVVAIVLIGALSAWVFARVRGRTVGLIYYLFISGILISPAVVTTLLVLQTLGVAGTQIGMILFYVGVSLPFATFLITGFIKTIPVELEEAARIDGASPFKVFRFVILPLLRPVVATTSFLALLNIWNDFLYPFIFLSGGDRQTLTMSLYNFVQGHLFTINWNLLFADVVLVNLPLIIGYIFVQRQLVTGLLGASYK
jgi:raffinose/stachyose/melibiose transport system permease protein